MRDEIDDVIKRTQRYWYVDGLTEIAIGFLLVLIGLLFYAQETIDIDASTAPLVAIGVPAVLLGA